MPANTRKSMSLTCNKYSWREEYCEHTLQRLGDLATSIALGSPRSTRRAAYAVPPSITNSQKGQNIIPI